MTLRYFGAFFLKQIEVKAMNEGENDTLKIDVSQTFAIVSGINARFIGESKFIYRGLSRSGWMESLLV